MCIPGAPLRLERVVVVAEVMGDDGMLEVREQLAGSVEVTVKVVVTVMKAVTEQVPADEVVVEVEIVVEVGG